MIKLFEIKMHNAIFDIEYAKVDLADKLYVYKVYCSVGNSGDLLAGDFDTINEAINWITNDEQAKASAYYYTNLEQELMNAYGEYSIASEEWYKNIPNGTMAIEILREYLLEQTYYEKGKL
jgi:hypothetical protein